MQTTAFGELQVAELTPVAGWTFAYNINADLVTTTLVNGGAVVSDGGRAKLSTGAAANASAKIETKLPLRYTPGQGALARFTAVFAVPTAGSVQLIGVGDDNDGLFVGCNGTSFGVMRRVAGVDHWTPDEAFGSVFGSLDASASGGQFDITKGNIYQIQYQWLGYGQITFSIENPQTGAFERARIIRYANTSAATTLRNPTLPIMASIENTSNATDLVMYTPSAMAFVEGKVENPPPVHPLTLSRTLVAADTGITTQHNVLTISNQAEWQSIANRVRVKVRRLSVGVDGIKNVTIRITRNTTLGGTPSYSDYSANTSPVQFDTAGTTLTNGTVVFAGTLQKVDSAEYNLDDWDVSAAPGERLTISAASTGAADVDIALNWSELF